MESRDMTENCEQAGNFDIIDKGSGNIELRSLYLELTNQVVLNDIYEPAPHIDEGGDWLPGKALKRISVAHEKFPASSLQSIGRKFIGKKTQSCDCYRIFWQIAMVSL